MGHREGEVEEKAIFPVLPDESEGLFRILSMA